MMNYRKYQRQYFLPPYPCMKWAEKDYVASRTRIFSST